MSQSAPEKLTSLSTITRSSQLESTATNFMLIFIRGRKNWERRSYNPTTTITTTTTRVLVLQAVVATLNNSNATICDPRIWNIKTYNYGKSNNLAIEQGTQTRCSSPQSKTFAFFWLIWGVCYTKIWIKVRLSPSESEYFEFVIIPCRLDIVEAPKWNKTRFYRYAKI